MTGTPVAVAAATPRSKIQRNASGTPGGPKVREEKIRVTVRMRPLNTKEQAMYDLIAWDCLDEHTIVFKNPNQEKPATPLVCFFFFFFARGIYCLNVVQVDLYLIC